ncbi:MAG TPA: bifunctional (p)ppGpp synthetase/guanosine-3',5'-bis(diphosphate) 3'-pyrophosphohydrolase [Rhodospirillaceae bacterium]|nr:bifunctional (p)ppGpp synthetase/guanosine-3',5'-bis(diphosphate) 3'-pyrophosphohydrolase [Alphaproteobacteria bacterium]OUT42144.1 MAG: bifunctional (p)ppGpp synthetase/guanosine-3',5'-bis(diphosphate) 3'-pyrophosphohydrolase [Micavibrio sp. TMED2]HCI46875.1 bifunctional (p)ppGpp synthetase/guanosine-3',5'-bis(diphosphate) 3'-pyrophosphohydrolase [Rhodospirillaceae bacterium]MAS46240.1 bifunctional (p)ppGpp synthetase/guanosine-3',5'-bis(diphosphate) 3'-pyrophosphohydrolase [Alphaproteobacte|tara:strand:+ start:3805 stop:5976 length:2172 start_codon:yes stop_codon:yes gene_type:complete
MIRQFELVERVKAYDPHVDEDALNRAYVFSMKAHGSQTRASGDPYFTHPLEVAGILTEMRLDTASIITALLHDTVEDTEATDAQIRELFGDEVANLVEGVTKLSQIKLNSDQSKQAENFRKLVLAMSEDIRVLLVKLADRLHNMQTLEFIPREDKRKRIARETLDLYAPLAERIGVAKMKEQLEDLSFAQLVPEARESILTRLQFLREEGGNLVDNILGELRELMTANEVDVEIYGREKTPYSIWRKMQRQNVAFEQLSDIMAFRIIAPDIATCYQVLGVIHGNYPLVPGRFKDYISTPKPNGYKSLHTTVIGPERQRIEIQIRTQDMHESAELGVAAHWAYKQGTPGADTPKFRWLRDFLDILDNAQRPEEFLEHTKLELFQDQVFCFSPRGDVIALPSKATAVDFAYAVHSDIGDTCVGAKVNGRLVPLDTALNNGDQVEIQTSKNQTPSPTWERFVVTGKARARIRRFVRSQQRAEYASLGKAMVQKVFRQEGYEFTEKAVQNVLKTMRFDENDDLYAAVGMGNLTSREVFNTIFPGHRSEVAEQLRAKSDENVVPIQKARQERRRRNDHPVPLRGLIPGLAVHFARCCHPLPGDRIVGIVTSGKGVTIHTIDCDTLESFAETPERWIDVAWDVGPEAPEEHTGRLQITLANEPGSLGTLSTVIGKNDGNILNLKVTNRSLDFWDMLIDIQVKDVRHLTNIIAALRATPVINAVDRAQGR